MASIDNDFVHNVKDMENIIFVCFGTPKGDELPQVATPDDVVIDLMSRQTGKSHSFADALYHHQTEYEGE